MALHVQSMWLNIIDIRMLRDMVVMVVSLNSSCRDGAAPILRGSCSLFPRTIGIGFLPDTIGACTTSLCLHCLERAPTWIRGTRQCASSFWKNHGVRLVVFRNCNRIKVFQVSKLVGT